MYDDEYSNDNYLAPPLPRSRGHLRANALRNPGAVQLTNVPQAPADDLISQYSERARDLQEQAATLQAERPDVSGYQQYAQQRSEQGRHALVMALAAQRAGKDFAPLGQSFLKRAAEAEEPISVGRSGFVTSQGQYLEDPTFGREQRVSLLMTQAQKYDALAQQARSAQERAVAQREAAAARAEAQREAQETRRYMAGIAADNQIANRAARDEQANWRAEDAMTRQFDAVTKDLREELNAVRKVGQLAPTLTGRRPNAIEQQTMIVLLNKFIDPGSVVMTSEFGRVAQAQGLVQRAQNLSNRIMNGELMSDTLISQIVQMADFYDRAATAKLQSIGDQYHSTATRRGLNVSSVIRDPNYRPPGSAGAPAGGGFKYLGKE